MKKEVENKKPFIIDLSSSEPSSDESDKEILVDNTEELKKYLLTNDDEKIIKKIPPRKQKSLSRKEKLLLTIMLVKKNQRNLPKKTHPRKNSSKVMISKDFKRRQKNLAQLLLIIPKEKITNTWLNMTAKRFTSVLSTLKTSLFTKILIDERSIV